MFKIGDKVVYPMHGAGTIVAIEEKEVLEEKKKYYIMQLPIGEMKVMIPMDKVEEIGLREIINDQQVEEVYSLLRDDQDQMSRNWNRRYRANMEKLRTGDVYEVSEVVRNLTIREKMKGLSTGEKKMLNSARQILVSELVLAEEKDEVEVEITIDDIFSQYELES